LFFFKMRIEVKAPTGSSSYESPFAIQKECVNKLPHAISVLTSSRRPQSTRED
jgi:hypothetical protein